MKSEPVLAVGTITALVAAAISLLTAFGVDVTDDQREAILAFVAIVGPVVAALVARRKVTPV